MSEWLQEDIDTIYCTSSGSNQGSKIKNTCGLRGNAHWKSPWQVLCRFDYVKGFSGRHVADYVAATNPCFVVGEFWDSLAYDGSVPKRNQDAHRQRTVNWLNTAQGGATAFDVTTKGILHAVFEVQFTMLLILPTVTVYTALEKDFVLADVSCLMVMPQCTTRHCSNF